MAIEEKNVLQAREGEQWTEVQFGRNRYYNFIGSTRPSTVSVKELGGDNGFDQVSDGRTDRCLIEIGKDFRSVTVVDGGKGISTNRVKRKDNDKMSTHLFLNIAKLYTSTNYQETDKNASNDASNTIGQNGIGSKISNFCSAHFTAGIVAEHPEKHKVRQVVSGVDEAAFDREVHDAMYGTSEHPAVGAVRGYHFQQGHAVINGEPMNEEVPEWIAVNVPLLFEQDHPLGYFVHAEYDNTILGDDIDCGWIQDYITARIMACKPQKRNIFVTYRYPVKMMNSETSEESVTMKEIIYCKPFDYKEVSEKYKKDIDSGHMELILDWDQMCEKVKEEHPDDVFGPFTSGFYTIYYSKDAELIKDIPNIAQGAKVSNPKQFLKKFNVGNTTISIPVPCVYKLSSKVSKGLTYTDQTKEKLGFNAKTPMNIHINNLEKQFDRLPDIKEYFNRLANDKYLKSNQKGGYRSDSYWPAVGGKTARQFFGKKVDTPKDLQFILNNVQSDPDVIRYCKDKGIDINNLNRRVDKLIG